MPQRMNAEPRDRRMSNSLGRALTADANPRQAVPARRSALAASHVGLKDPVRPGATSCTISRMQLNRDAHAHPIASCRTTLAAGPGRATDGADCTSSTEPERGSLPLLLDKAATVGRPGPDGRDD